MVDIYSKPQRVDAGKAGMVFISAIMSVESLIVTWFKCDERYTIVWSYATYAHLIH